MYIVFKSMDEWLKKEPNMRDKFRKTYDFVYKGAHDYAKHMSESVKQKSGFDIKIEFSEILLKQSLIDAFDDLLRLKNYEADDEGDLAKLGKSFCERA